MFILLPLFSLLLCEKKQRQGFHGIPHQQAGSIAVDFPKSIIIPGRDVHMSRDVQRQQRPGGSSQCHRSWCVSSLFALSLPSLVFFSMSKFECNTRDAVSHSQLGCPSAPSECHANNNDMTLGRRQHTQALTSTNSCYKILSQQNQ